MNTIVNATPDKNTCAILDIFKIRFCRNAQKIFFV